MAAEGEQPRLPSLQEFTPEQIGGPEAAFELLRMAEMGIEYQKLREKIRARWFSDAASTYKDPERRFSQQANRAGNLISGARNAGLISSGTEVVTLSDLGVSILAAFRGDGAQVAFAQFASFLLREKNGIELLEVSRFLKKRDGRVSKTSVDEELEFRGYLSSTNSGNSSKLRLWLEVAGLIDREWNIDEDRFAELAGMHATDIADWQRLSEQQRQTLILLRLRAEGDLTPIASRDLLEMLRQRGVSFRPAQVRNEIYRPLLDEGWIDERVESGGRGGNAGLISPTLRTLELDVEKIEGLELGSLPPELQSELGKPIGEILNDLDSSSKHTRGIALELLSLRLSVECGLFPVDLRVRGAETGGAEVDLVAEGAHLHFSRWLFQCKNVNSSVGLDVLAKEVGMAAMLRAQVVVLVTTNKFRSSVIEYARKAAATTAIQVVLIDGEMLSKYRMSGAKSLRDALHRHAVLALTLKRSQLGEVPVESDRTS